MPQGPFLRKYGAEAIIPFSLFEVDGVDFRTDATHAAGDTKTMKDYGAEANSSNAFADEGQGYSITVSATEMQASSVIIYVADQSTKAWLDDSLVIETYGNPAAMHPMDFSITKAAALATYDPPTKGEMDSGMALLATVAKQDTIDGIVDNILVDTAVIGASGVGLSNIPWNAGWDAEVQSEVADGLAAYDPPTKGEMDSGHALLATVAKQDVIDGIVDNILIDTAVIGASGVGLSDIPWNADWDAEAQSECTDALNAYDPPTKGEMDSGLALLATEAKQDTIDGIVDNILVDTAVIGASGVGLSNIPWNASWDAEVQSEVADGLTAYDPPTKGEMDSGLALLATEAKQDTIDTVVDAIKAKTDNQPAGVQKNVALPQFVFLMVDSTDHITPKTGLTVTAQISKDGGAYASAANSVAEIANGLYEVDGGYTQAEMNADAIALRFSATGADDRTIIIDTSA